MELVRTSPFRLTSDHLFIIQQLRSRKVRESPKIPAKDMISGWLVQQTAAALGLWLVPVMVIFALASYALLRKASV